MQVLSLQHHCHSGWAYTRKAHTAQVPNCHVFFAVCVSFRLTSEYLKRVHKAAAAAAEWMCSATKEKKTGRLLSTYFYCFLTVWRQQSHREGGADMCKEHTHKHTQKYKMVYCCEGQGDSWWDDVYGCHTSMHVCECVYQFALLRPWYD